MIDEQSPTHWYIKICEADIAEFALQSYHADFHGIRLLIWSWIRGSQERELPAGGFHTQGVLQRRIDDFCVLNTLFPASRLLATIVARFGDAETIAPKVPAVLRSVVNNVGIDAVISSAAPTTSHRPTEGRYFGYTGVCNVLDYPAVTVRSRLTFDKTNDPNPSSLTTLNPLDEEVAKQYDPELFHGMPIGLEVIGQRLEEDKVLAIAEEVERVVQGTTD